MDTVVCTAEEMPPKTHENEIDPALIAKVITSYGQGLTVTDACALHDVDRVTFYRYLKRHEAEICNKFLAARASFKLRCLERLLEPGDERGASAKVKGNAIVMAAIDERFRPSHRVEYSGHVGHDHRLVEPVDLAQYQRRRELASSGKPILDAVTDKDIPSLALPNGIDKGEMREIETSIADMTPLLDPTHGLQAPLTTAGERADS